MGVKYVAAISDTDILIHFACADEMKVLGYLFKEIIVPFYIFNVELKRKAGKLYGLINGYITDKNGIFKIVNRDDDYILNKVVKQTIEEKKDLIGPGECECAGYADALGVPIIISDNHTEFKYLQEFITLNYSNILTLCVYHGYMTKKTAESIFEAIKKTMNRPTILSFTEIYGRSISRFRTNGWDKYLKL